MSSVQSRIKTIAYEYVRGERPLDKCSIPGIKWSSLRRVLLVTKQCHEKNELGTLNPSDLLEKRRSESKFWLDTGLKWPSLEPANG